MPTHAEKRIVPYSPDQMYALVADVETYPDFLPWCVGARIKKREGSVFFADLMIGYKLIRERFTSRVELHPEDRRIDVTYTDGPFRYLNNHWVFVEQEQGGCLIDFYVDFEFKNLVLQRVMGLFFNEAVRRMVQAFEDRAKTLYG
ncbi:type II toxin-antitoxin system RatA family toxin [Thalassobaculum sp.]|uniref:type II toxin-antitoxin system RatA family toxin n=1 Tax=Thalassobaculum sp. TaxID=2022740 RepID=UPI003B5BB944